MQKKFIGEIEKQSYDQIDVNKDKIKVLGIENDTHIEHNDLLEANIGDIVKEQEEVTDACNKLVKLNNLKGKISQKVASITKEHKFFTQNTVCPTCDQNIEEEFRLNRIADVKDEAKKLRTKVKITGLPFALTYTYAYYPMLVQAKAMVNNLEIGKKVVSVDPRYFRPTEVDILIGDASKAKEELGWEPELQLDDLVEDMMTSDLLGAKKEKYLRDFGTSNYS